MTIVLLPGQSSSHNANLTELQGSETANRWRNEAFMLSSRERHQLAVIEHELTESSFDLERKMRRLDWRCTPRTTPGSLPVVLLLVGVGAVESRFPDVLAAGAARRTDRDGEGREMEE